MLDVEAKTGVSDETRSLTLHWRRNAETCKVQAVGSRRRLVFGGIDPLFMCY